MRFRILGPLEISGAGHTLTVTAARQRVVLSTLLLDANCVVSTAQLADALWDDAPPTTARGQVQICVSALRKTLTRLGLPDRIVTRPPGYLIEVADGDLDLHYFDRLVLAGQQALAESRLDDAAEALSGALALWRGTALAGVESQALRAAATRLDERRLAVTEDWLDVELHRGRHQHVVGELRELVATHPLRERLHAQHMRALSGAGRPAEALAAYRSARRVFLDELGLEPGGELRRLERAILTDARADEPADDVPVSPPVPRLLPADPAELSGRDRPLAVLREALAGNDGAAVPLVAISGPVGVGKSTVAVRAAHALAPAYPDGQLYLNLLDPDGRPVAPAAALERFLRALGLSGDTVPAGLDERAELYRDRIAGRRVLVVLDDVTHERQVLPLLPGASGAGVLVTSRRRLTGLTGARAVHLDPLDIEDSVRLLATALGPPRLAADPAAARALARLCDGLPLALRIAAARLAARPHWTMAHLADRLRDEARRLDELAFGGLDVRARLATSYAALSPAARLLFRSLGALPDADLPLPLAGRLPGVRDEIVEDALEELVDAQLVEVGVDPTRYRLAGLVRLYAAERLAGDEPITRAESA
ncbi:NB-ARC domain-containing protein [Micromonospora lupini]|uniref:AfsR/SARP family transcriptional regulator n=1 Tax=Micromonospora lupini TaxID=285679 RepID=UPI00224E03AF|nr:BTAD domain-containing putative transcriptional regulator [Micromonospora lupini]MCX5066827.1 NB-ARC domain-containing protein [Micromonospora lupini]